MRAFREWRAQLDQELRLELNGIYQAWIDEFGGYVSSTDGSYHADVDFPSKRVLLEQLEKMSTADILGAIRSTSRRYHAQGNEPLPRYAVPRYFYAVCRNMGRLADEKRRHVEVSLEDLLKLVPELATLALEVSDLEPSDPWRFCATRLWTHGWNVNHGDYREDVPAPPDRIAALVGPKSINARDPLLGTQTAHDVAVRTIRAMLPACGQTCTCGRPKRPVREEDYPRCARCGQTIEPVDRRDRCAPTSVTWNGTEFWSVPYASEPWIQQCKIAENSTRYRRLKEHDEPRAYQRCPECNVPWGGDHHLDCRHAACPVCWEPVGSCARRDHAAPAMPRSLPRALASMRRISGTAEDESLGQARLSTD